MAYNVQAHEQRASSIYGDLAFFHGPNATLVLQERQIVSASLMVETVFGWKPSDLQGKSMKELYPALTDYEIIGKRAYAALAENDCYYDARFMRTKSGEIIWMEGCGRAFNRKDPLKLAIWSYRPLQKALSPELDRLTPTEKTIAYYLTNGFSSKEIALALQRSPRTIEVHRANMLRKMGVRNSSELVRKLLGAD